jgi:hypothetical protein
LSVWTEQGGLPGLGCNELCIKEQSNGTDEEVVEILYGDVGCALIVYDHRYRLAVRI